MRLASSWIQLVTSVSAGPPLGGLYLKPPSSGGLCDGVTTMPSARWRQLSFGRLATMIACEMAGVGVYPSAASTRTSTPFATSTPSAVRVAGSDRAWVSRPMKSGPLYPRWTRYLQMASVVARMWASLKALRSDDPRWPDVPKATRCAGSDGSGRRSK